MFVLFSFSRCLNVSIENMLVNVNADVEDVLKSPEKRSSSLEKLKTSSNLTRAQSPSVTRAEPEPCLC